MQDYLSLTGHSYNAVVLLMGKPSHDKLNEEEMTIIREAAVEARAFQRDLISPNSTQDITLENSSLEDSNETCSRSS